MTAVRKFISHISLMQIVAIFGLVLCVFLFETKALPERYALGGWSPVEWSAKVLHPQNFAADFSNGVETYRHSSFMWIYPIFEKYFSIPTLTLNYLTIFGEMLVTVFLFSLIYVIFIKNEEREVDHFFFLIVSTLVLASHIRHANAARFYLPFWSGLFYVYADLFRVSALVMIALDKRLWAAFLFLVSYTIHPGASLHAMVFGIFFMLPNLREILRKKDTYVGLAVFLLGSGLWTYLNYNSSSFQTAQIPKETWIALTKLMNFHWYPLSLDMFSSQAYRTVIPLISFLGLSLYILKTDDDTKFSRNLFFGVISIVLMVLFGWVNAEYFQFIPFIKVSFQRSSDLVFFFFVPLILYRFLKILGSTNIIAASLATSLVFSVFFNYGFPLLPVILFCIADWQRLSLKNYFIILLFPVILFVGAFVNRYFAQEFFFQSIVMGDFKLFILFCLSLSYFWIVQILKARAERLSYILLSVMCIFLCYPWLVNRLPSVETVEEGKSFLEAQLWANKHTPERALFLVDPTIVYGWRDFSERSSFGNFREWLHTSWLYDSKYESYTEGMRRFGLMKISLEKYLNEPIKQSSHGSLFFDVRTSFYGFSSEYLKQISMENKISYLVLQKKFINQKYNLPVVFENGKYIIYGTGL